MVNETILNFSGADYEAPEVKVIEVIVEKGFATSDGPTGTLPEGDAELAGYGGWY